MTDWMRMEQTHEFDVYPKRELCIVKGENDVVFDAEGNNYIDCVAGHGVANVGHCNAEVVAAIQKQIKTLITCSNVFFNNSRAEFLALLATIAPKGLNRAFLCNSGTEAIEAALKFTRFSTGKTDFVTAMRGFHGRTFGAMSATFTKKYRASFEPGVPGFHYTPFNKFEKLAEIVTDRTAGILLEVIQGEGGVNVGDKLFFQQVRQLCDDKGILLIIDEVQTGFCRTGRMFAVEHMGIVPDIMTVAKAASGGLPMGAVLCSDGIEIPAGKHGSTFGGNPLSCSAGTAAIQFMLNSRLAEQAEAKGSYFMDRLKAIQSEKIKDIRGLGLMVGIELSEKVQPYLMKLMDEGILALPAGSKTLRFLPPLTISYEHLDIVAHKVDKLLTHSF